MDNHYLAVPMALSKSISCYSLNIDMFIMNNSNFFLLNINHNYFTNAFDIQLENHA
jgi:hypothetical protein